MNRKRLVGTLLALCLVFSLLPFGSLAAGFQDVDAKAFYADAVNWAVSHDPQITDGVDSTHFAPTATCTRDQVVTFLWRAVGKPDVSAKNPFKDVTEKDYFYKAVLWALDKGITDGTSDTTFSPKEACTRAQVVTFLWRAMNKIAPQTKTSPFVDVQKTDDFFYNPVLWAFENGITDGTDETHFSPGQSCTRGQIVTFLYRALASTFSLVAKQTTVDQNGNVSGYIFTYDEHGNNVRVTSLDGKKWENHTFDANGNMIAREDYLGSKSTYEYDDMGNIIVSDDGDDVNVDVEMDSKGRIVKETYHYKSTDGDYDEVVVYEYVGDTDNIRAVKDGDGNLMVLYSYDEQGRETLREHYNVGDTTPSFKVMHEYDAAGNEIRMRSESYSNDACDFWYDVKYEYDKDGMLVKETMTSSDNDSSVTTYAYTFDASGALIKEVQTTTMSEGTIVTTIEYTTIEVIKLLRFGGFTVYPENF